MNHYQLKNSIEVYIADKNIHLLTLDSHFTYLYDECFLQLLSLLENGSNIEHLYSVLKSKKFNITKEEIRDVLLLLSEDNALNINNECEFISTTEEKYSHQIEFFNNFYSQSGLSKQKILKNSHVVIAGIGGVGSWIAITLAMAGIGKLTLIDPDTIDITNLTRQIGYFKTDIGCYKVDSLSKKIKNINSEIEVIKHKFKITNDCDALDNIFKSSHFVISCIDKPSIEETGKIISRKCYQYSIPHIISGGYNGHQGFIGPTIIPGKTRCWDCIVSSINDEYLGWTPIIRGKSTGTLGCFSAIVSNIQAWECIRILTGDKETPMQNAKGEFNFRNLDLELKSISNNKDCKICKEV